MRLIEFYNKVTNSKEDIISIFLSLLKENKINYCVIGGFAMNAYCEPLVTLDFDCVVDKERINELRIKLKEVGFKIKKHPHTIEITHKKSKIKIHIQIDDKYQEFIKFAKHCNVMGYKIYVARKEDLLISKTWAYSDTTREKLKREKDLLDIKRLVANYPELKNFLPKNIIINN